jgi:hypothetical protein
VLASLSLRIAPPFRFVEPLLRPWNIVSPVFDIMP